MKKDTIQVSLILQTSIYLKKYDLQVHGYSWTEHRDVEVIHNDLI